MPTQANHAPQARDPDRRRVLGAGLLIALATLAAYSGSLSGPFVFDDPASIVDNPTIRSLAHIGAVLSPPASAGQTVGGRPVLNLSLAIDYAIGGTRVWPYHATNLLIHVLAALALFGIARRSLGKLWAGFAVALLWALHPLQTESVTYVIQRAESLMGLFYLLTVYGFVRGTEPGCRAARIWLGLSWLACLAGMATKEVMVSAPVIVLLYDRTFRSGSFRGAWAGRKGYYLALGSTWLLLAWLVAGTGGDRGGTSGFGLGVSWGRYLLTQGPAILHYLRLVVWPDPLVFYYTARWVHGPAAWAESAVVLLLIAGTAYALCRSPAVGFLGASFFAILAPTSLVPGPAETLAEHRMYLAIAAVLGLAAAGLRRIPPAAGLAGCLAAALALGLATARRNEVYRTAIGLWSDTVRRSPDNPYAQNNLGVALTEAGRLPEALDCLNRAVGLKPDFADGYNDRGNVLAAEGRLDEAVSDYRAAVRLKPGGAEALNNLGNALRALGRTGEAIADFREALRLDPGYAAAYNGLGAALTDAGRLPDAVDAFGRALRIDPGYAQADFNLGVALADEGRTSEAMARFEDAIRLEPDLVEARLDLGNALAGTGRLAEAAAQYKAALRVRPNYPPARDNLARIEAIEAAGIPSP